MKICDKATFYFQCNTNVCMICELKNHILPNVGRLCAFRCASATRRNALAPCQDSMAILGGLRTGTKNVFFNAGSPTPNIWIAGSKSMLAIPSNHCRLFGKCLEYCPPKEDMMEKRGNTLELHVPEGTSQEVQDWLKAEVMKLFRAIKLRDRCGKDCSLDHAEANKHRPELASCGSRLSRRFRCN